jgi:hypothetical protein
MALTNTERITALAQDIYLARHNQTNDVTGDDLTAFLNQTMGWVNQFIPEIEKKADWNFVRTNDNTIGTVTNANVISYDLPVGIRKLVINYQRDLTIRFDTTIVSSFKLVNPNQSYDPSEPYDNRARATVLKRKVIFSRPLTTNEVGGTIVADTVSKIPRLSLTDVALLDILDDVNNDDIRQLFIMGVVKNQILPDIVQGGLTPTYAQKFDRFLAECIKENNDSADSDNTDRESFGWVGGVGF